jgi:hypothetical protein
MWLHTLAQLSLTAMLLVRRPTHEPTPRAALHPPKLAKPCPGACARPSTLLLIQGGKCASPPTATLYAHWKSGERWHPQHLTCPPTAALTGPAASGLGSRAPERPWGRGEESYDPQHATRAVPTVTGRSSTRSTSGRLTRMRGGYTHSRQLSGGNQPWTFPRCLLPPLVKLVAARLDHPSTRTYSTNLSLLVTFITHPCYTSEFLTV